MTVTNKHSKTVAADTLDLGAIGIAYSPCTLVALNKKICIK